MPTTLISLGPPITLVQNVIYALPAKLCRVQSTLAVDVSEDGTTWVALTGANTVGADTSAAFIRCTTGAPVLTAKGF